MHPFAKISVNSVCNLRCKMCDIGQKDRSSGLAQNLTDRAEIAPADWMAIFKRRGVRKVYIQGTEPLLYKGIDALLRACREEGVAVTLTTNGWFLSEHAQAVIESGAQVFVSLDGLEATHDKIRGRVGSFSRAWAGMALLSKAHTRVLVSLAVTPDNLGDISGLHLLLAEEGIPLLANHYNYIAPESCPGYDCLPTNVGCYRPADVDVSALWEVVVQHPAISWCPSIRSQAGLGAYYGVAPTVPLEWRRTCSVLQQVYTGRRVVMASDGSLIPSARCWIKMDLGNALRGDWPTGNRCLLSWMEKIKSAGLPPPCQRLCCAGLTV